MMNTHKRPNRFASLLLCLALVLSLAQPAMAQVTDEDLLAFFDDAVFVGDSIMQQWNNYTKARKAEGQDLIGNATFLAAQSYTLQRASRTDTWEGANLMVRGSRVSLSEGLVRREAGKVFIMLGVNDNGGTHPDRERRHFTAMIDNIRKRLPDIQIFILALTPMTAANEKKSFNQDHLDAYNVMLEELSKEMGLVFIDPGFNLKDERGLLAASYSNDKGIHLNELGLTILIHNFLNAIRGYLETGEVPVVNF